MEMQMVATQSIDVQLSACLWCVRSPMPLNLSTSLMVQEKIDLVRSRHYLVLIMPIFNGDYDANVFCGKAFRTGCRAFVQ